MWLYKSPRRSCHIVTCSRQSVSCHSTAEVQGCLFHKCNVCSLYLALRCYLTCPNEFRDKFPDSPAEERIRAQVSPCGIRCRKSGTVAGSSPTPSIFPVNVVSPCSLKGAWAKGPLEVQFHSLAPSQQYKMLTNRPPWPQGPWKVILDQTCTDCNISQSKPYYLKQQCCLFVPACIFVIRISGVEEVRDTLNYHAL
jgi:hypothetical protein